MLTISDLKKELESGKTPLDLVNDSISRLQASAIFNTTILELFESARSRAVQLEKESERTGATKGRLYGIPFIVKDNFLVKSTPTTAASNILGNFVAPYTATSIKKLEEEGAICIAKSNLDSFGHGSSTENSDYSPTLNPHDQTKVPGGSSGGSAAAVALNIVPFAMGTDTGGSLRQPSSFTGVFGLKPSYGLVSRNGVIAMASSTDCVGPVANSADDINEILDIISGLDPKDSTTIDKPLNLKTPLEVAKNVKIGVIKELMTSSVDDEVSEKVNQTIAQLKEDGHQIEEISIPEIEYSLAAYYIIVPAEISSNLARYDGIKYGYKSEGASTLLDTYQQSRNQGFNAENKRRILIGTYVLSTGYYDAYYKKAQQVRTLLIEAFEKAFKKYDILLSPVAPTTAFKIGKSTGDPLQMYLGDIMTVTPSLIGAPAISVPIGFGSKSKMPVGLQLIASRSSDSDLLKIAKSVQVITEGN